MESNPQDTQQSSPGVMAGLTAIFRNLLGLVLSRLELASLELAEVRAVILKLVAVFALGLLTAWFALACWTGLLIVLAWQSMGWTILAIIATVFTLATLALIWYIRSIVAQGKLSLSATMAELRSDRDALL